MRQVSVTSLNMTVRKQEYDRSYAIYQGWTHRDRNDSSLKEEYKSLSRHLNSLKKEVERLRAENVTLKRREESIKAKCMTSRDAQKKEIVRKIQELLTSM